MLNYHIVPPQILTWRNFLSSGVCCETSFSYQCIYCRQESNFPPYFGSCFCDTDVQLGNKESVILITMIYLLCTNCPRYMGSAQALATAPTQTWRHQLGPNWVTYESLVNNLPLTYESLGLCKTVSPRIITVLMWNARSSAFQPWLADVTMTRSKRSMTLRMRGAAACGPLSQRWHQRIHIHTQGIPSHPDHPAGDTRPSPGHRRQHHRCHSSCLTHIQVNPSLICHRLVICSQNSLILCNFLCD